jgi:hypothetical protein
LNREEVRAAGLARYRGERCPKGHHERYASVSCALALSAARPAHSKRKPKLSDGREKNLGQKIAQAKHIPLPKLREADVTPLNLPLVDLEYGACHIRRLRRIIMAAGICSAD